MAKKTKNAQGRGHPGPVEVTTPTPPPPARPAVTLRFEGYVNHGSPHDALNWSLREVCAVARRALGDPDGRPGTPALLKALLLHALDSAAMELQHLKADLLAAHAQTTLPTDDEARGEGGAGGAEDAGAEAAGD